MKRIIFVLIALTLSQSSYSQFKEKSEVGIIIGGGNYIGDINPKYNFYNTNFILIIIIVLQQPLELLVGGS